MRLFRFHGSKATRPQRMARNARVFLACALMALCGSNAGATTQLEYNLSGLGDYYTVMQSSDGNFYITSQAGGASGYGAVYKIVPGTRGRYTLTTLASYPSSSECGSNYSRLVPGPDGNLWGASACTGPQSEGEIYKISPTTGVLDVPPSSVAERIRARGYFSFSA